MADPQPFDPDWTICPGEMLAVTLEDLVRRGVTREAFDLPTSPIPGWRIDQVLAGYGPIQAAEADVLAGLTEIGPLWWLRLEAMHRAALDDGKIHSCHPGAPRRIQLRRTKGWRLPEGAVVCRRPTKWGNVWRVEPTREPGAGWLVRGPGDRRTNVFETKIEAQAEAVVIHRRWIQREPRYAGTFHPLDHLDEIRGRDLACTCRTIDPCHVDTLLDLANRTA